MVLTVLRLQISAFSFYVILSGTLQLWTYSNQHLASRQTKLITTDKSGKDNNIQMKLFVQCKEPVQG